MKSSIILFFTMVYSITVNAQGKGADDNAHFPIDSVTKKYVFTEVVKTEGSAAELYSRAKFFVADIFKSAKDVTQLQDDETKTILIKPIIQNTIKYMLYNGPYGYTSYQITVECKDGRYRYRFSDFYHKASDPKVLEGGPLEGEKPRGFTKQMWQRIRNQAYAEAMITLELLKNRMSPNSKTDF